MNQLVNMQVLTMSSREIAELVGARHNDVITTIHRLFDKGLLRSRRKSRREATGGRPIDVYDLVERDTHLVVAGYSDEHRARVIDRWQELESLQAPAIQVPQTLAGALRLAADQAEQIEQQAQQLAIAAPKVEFVDRYVESTGLKGFRQVAKLLGIKENLFRAFLSDQKIMYQISGEWVPYANHIDAGRFEVKTGASEGGHAFNQAKFTSKGIEYVARLLRDSKKIEPEKALGHG
jgi:phage antirepressor YoqD-like protein/predicted transcriptional regulator